jgi:hypothetical protein
MHYLASIGRLNRYSLRNATLIASQKPMSSLVGGFQTLLKLGLFVGMSVRETLILLRLAHRTFLVLERRLAGPIQPQYVIQDHLVSSCAT